MQNGIWVLLSQTPVAGGVSPVVPAIIEDGIPEAPAVAGVMVGVPAVPAVPNSLVPVAPPVAG
jgi:hypothetical protein